MTPSAVTFVGSDVLLNLNVEYQTLPGRGSPDFSPIIKFNTHTVSYVTTDGSNYVGTISAADITSALGAQAIATVPVTVQSSLLGWTLPIATLPFTVTTSLNVASAVAPPGASASVGVTSSPDSVTASLTTDPSGPSVAVTVVLYGSTLPGVPTPFQIGGTYFDVVASGPTCPCLDTLTVDFHVAPASPPASQDLLYSPDGGKTWNPVTDDWGNPYSTDFSGDCSGVFFDCGSSPPIDQLTGTIFFIRHLKTPTEQLTDLAAAVQALDIQAGLKNALGAKVQAVQAAVAHQDVTSACNVLGAFLNQVSAQTGKKLTATQASELTNRANAIRTTLGC
jgi:hypothetical protein